MARKRKFVLTCSGCYVPGQRKALVLGNLEVDDEGQAVIPGAQPGLLLASDVPRASRPHVEVCEVPFALPDGRGIGRRAGWFLVCSCGAEWNLTAADATAAYERVTAAGGREAVLGRDVGTRLE